MCVCVCVGVHHSYMVMVSFPQESSAQPARLPPTRSMSLAEDIHRKEEQVSSRVCFARSVNDKLQS